MTLDCQSIFLSFFLTVNSYLFVSYDYRKLTNSRVWATFVKKIIDVDVVVQFYSWFKLYFPLFLGMVMYDNEFETMANKI